MKITNTLEILQLWDKQVIQKLVSALNTDGIISDEDRTGLSSCMVEKWSIECEVYLRKFGYLGGEIKRYGKYFDTHGAIYALYDSSALDSDDALQHLISISKHRLTSMQADQATTVAFCCEPPQPQTKNNCFRTADLDL
jgi:hypothetical protein